MDVNPDTRGYAKVKSGSHYSGVSERTFRDWLKQGLPHFRLRTGTILVAYRDIDQWLEKYRVEGGQDRVNDLVEEVTREFVSN